MFTPERWQQMEELFAEAIEWPTEERQTRLARVCGADTELQGQLLKLLRWHEQPEGFLEAPACRLLDTRPKLLSPGESVGPYRVTLRLGEGGMGVVYLAERADGQFDKKVAIKLLPASATSDFLVQRFRAERQLLAQLEHPNIAHLLDGGTTADGSPYLVMEYVAGQAIDVYCNLLRLGVRERLELFLQVCAAVDYAHRQRVVHRDLKPGNILVSAEGTVKLLDFGIARLLEPAAEMTATHNRMLTPAYAAPEQVNGGQLGPTVDVYALGVVLHELLTCKRPVPSDKQRGESQVFERPSRVGEGLAEPPSQSRLLRGELDAIVLRALAPSAAERYPSVEAFACDLRDYLADRPVAAFGRSWLYRTGKFLSRHRATALLVATLLVLVAGSSWFLSGPRVVPGGSTVVVLPLTGLGTPDQEYYLVDGMTTDITTQLGKVADLTVIADRAARQYKHSTRSLREIARELGATHVLTGSVRWSKERIRIAAQLVEPETGRQLWAEEYDRQLKDVFAIQSEVARGIALALEARLSAGEQARLERAPTANLTAYQYYLRGREYYNRYNPRDIEYAVQLFKEALVLDPDFAQAHSGLASAYIRKFGNGTGGAFWLAVGCAEARQAVALAPSLAESYNAMGTCYSYSGKQAEGREAYRRSIALNPSYLAPVLNYGFLLLDHGDIDEALRWLQKAHALDPADASTCQRIAYLYLLLGELDQVDRWVARGLTTAPDNLLLRLMREHTFWRRGQVDRVRRGTQRLLQDEPNFLFALYMAGEIERYQGRWSQARLYHEKALGLVADSAWLGPGGRRLPTLLAHVAAMENRPEQVIELLAQSAAHNRRELESGTEDWRPWFDTAAVHAIRGERDQAVSALTRAVEAGYRDLFLLENDPLWRDLRGDGRFVQLVARLKGMREVMRVRAMAQKP